MRNKFLNNLGATFFSLALSSASLTSLGASNYYYRSRRGGYTGNKQYLADPGLTPFSSINFPEIQKTSGAVGGMDAEADVDFHFEKGQKIKELLIVDGAVQNKSVFLSQDRPGVDVIEIESGKSGIVQLLSTLTKYRNLEAVHVISHAKSGSLQLGNDVIDAKTFEENVSALAALNGAIKPGGDLLFYGCELAKGEDGKRFLEVVKGNYDFDIAASNDLTGNDASKADWDLEIQTGDIEATPLPESIALKDFTGELQFSGTINFQEIRNAGDYNSFGGGKSDTDFWTSASNEYTLYTSGSYYGTGTSGNALYTGSYGGTVTMNFDGSATFNATSIYVKFYNSGNPGNANFNISSNLGSIVTNYSVAHSGTTIPLSANNTGITTLTVSYVGGDAPGGAFYIDNLVVANVSTGGGDTTPPEVTSIVRQSPTDATTNATSATFRVTFDEDVSNVSTDGSDFTMSGAGTGGTATITGASTVSASIYDVTIGSIDTDGLIDLGFAGGQDIQDLASNAFGGTNNGTEQTYTIDQTGASTTVPDLATASDSGSEDDTSGGTTDNRTNDLTPTFTGTTEIGASVIVTSSVEGSLGSAVVDGSGNWTLTPSSDLTTGAHTITAQATDALGNTGTTSGGLAITLDNSGPTVAISSTSSPGPTNDNPIPVTITFSEEVERFKENEITVANGTTGDFASADSTTFTVNVTPSGNGTVTIDVGAVATNNVAAAIATDLALNPNSAATQFTISYDGTAPTISSSSPADNATGVAVADDITITFNEDIQFGAGAFQIRQTSDDSPRFSIDASNPTGTTNVASISGATLTINPGTSLAAETGYYVFIVSGTPFLDLAGNAFSGLNNNSDLNFTTVDVTAPTLSNQALAQTDADDLEITYQSDETGTLYYVVTTNSSTPTQAQILAGNDQSGTSTNVVSSGNAAVTVTGSDQTIALNGLTLASTTYHLFIYEEDAIGNESSVVTNSAAIDATEPTLINQALAQTDVDDLEITYQSNETGTLYYVVTSNSSTPTQAQILAGNDQSGTSTNVVSSGNAAVTVTGSDQTIALNGLTLASTTYHLFIYEEDAIGNQSSVVTNSAAIDATAPTLTNQALAQTAADDLEITYQSDETGTLYYVVTTNSSTPTQAQILAGNDQSGAATNVVSSGNAAVTVTGSDQTIALNGLTLANTTYHLFIYEEDAIGNESSVVTNNVAIDVTAPTLINQALAQTAPDDLEITYQSDETGTLYYVVTTNSSTPTQAQILAGNDQSGTSTNVVSSGNAAVTVTGSDQTIALNGLTLASTTYHLFIYEEDAIGNESSVVTNSVATDLTAPTLINQALAQTDADDLEITYQSDETGTLYYVVTTNSSTPTQAQILAGNDQSGTSTNVVSSGNAAVTVTGSDQTIALNGLTLASTTYHLFIFEEDATGNESSVVTNSAAIDATAPTLINQALAQTDVDDLEITYQSNETGTLYYVVTTNSSTPTQAQILAGNDQSGTSTNVVSSGNAAVTVTGSDQTIALNGLTLASTTYHLFIYEEDAIGNESSVVTNSASVDATAPTLINQALAQTDVDDLEITYQSNETGTLYYVVTTNSSTPTQAQILAGNDQAGTSTNVVSSGNAAVTVTGSDQTIALNGLTLASTTYHLFIYEEDAIGNESSVVTNSASADVTAPTLINQALAQTDADDLEITYQSNETGTLYYVVTTNSSTPTQAQILAGNDQSGTSTNVVSSGNAAVTVTGSDQTIALNGLTLASSTYHLFIYEEDAIGNESSVVTNSAAIDATAPTLINQALAQTDADDLEITYQSNETGTLYYVVTTNSSTPTQAQILAGNDQAGTSTNVVSSGNAAVTVTGSDQTIALNGLTLASTTYHLFIYEEDAIGNESSVVTNSASVDATAPTLINQALAQTDVDDLEITYQSNETGTLYYVVTTNSSTPTQAQILAGNDQAGTSTNVVSSGNAAVTVTGSDQTIALNGLTLASTTYHLFIYEEDAIGNESSVVTNSASVDVTAPTLINQALAQTDADDLEITYQSNETGTLYYVVTTNSSTPTQAQILAGNDQSGTSTNVVSSGNAAVTVTGSDQTIALNGLTLASTTYHLFIYEEDAIGNESSVVTNSAAIDATAPTLINQALAQTDADDLEITYQSNETGTLYYVVTTNSSTPTQAQILAGNDQSGTSTNVVSSGNAAVTVTGSDQTIALNGLTLASTTYHLFIYEEDAIGNESSVVTNSAAIDATAPTLTNQALAQTDADDLEITYQSDETGTLYYVVTTNSSTPTQAQILAGNDQSGTSTNVVSSGNAAVTVTGSDQTIALNGLTLASTTYHLFIYEEDAIGNESSVVTNSAAIDATAPTLINQALAQTDVDDLEITYQSNETGTLYYVVTTNSSTPTQAQILAGNDQSGTSTNVVSSGNAAVTVTGSDQTIALNGLTLASTTYHLFIYEEDAIGNESSVVTNSAAIDATAPTLINQALAQTDADDLEITYQSNETGTLYYVVTTNSSTPTQAQILAGNDQAGTSTNVVSSGNAAVTVTGSDQTIALNGLTLASTTYHLFIYEEDAIGNESSVVTNSAVIDATAPVISAVSPSSSSFVNTTNVGYTLSEAIASGTVSYTQTGGTTDGSSPHVVNLTGTELNSGTRASAALTSAPTLVDGAIYTIAFDGTDAAGNTATTVSSTSVTFDNTAPSATSFTRKTPTDQNTNADAVTYLATFSEDVTGVDMSDFTAIGVTGTSIAVSQVTASTYDVTVSGGALPSFNGLMALNFNSPSITDLAGNALPNSEPATDDLYNIDNTAPTVAITTPIEGDNIVEVSESSDVEISGTTTGVEDGQSVTVSFSDGSTTAGPVNASVTSNAWTASLADISGLNDGAITVTADVSDLAGNAATQGSESITLDQAPPTISTTSPGDDVTNVDIEADITITFNENIQFGSGIIQLIDLIDASGNVTIDASSPGSAASISGAVLTIANPSGFLEESMDYAVRIAATAVEDIGGNAFAGIVDNTDFNFTTEAPPIISIGDAMVTEGNTGTADATFTVSLDKTSPKTITIDYATSDNTATTADSDYTAVSTTTLTFSPSETSKNVTVTVVGDTRDEDAESFFLDGTNPVNASFADNQGEGTITDDDDAPTVAFTATSSNGEESVSSADITVDVSTASSKTITVDYAVTGTATGSGTDYELADGTLTFNADDVSETITIAGIVDDAILETNETVILTLSSPSNATLGTNSTHTYTITENDNAAVTIADATLSEAAGTVTLTATLDNVVQGGFDVTISSADGTASESDGDYTAISEVLTFAGTAGETQTFTVAVADDDILEGNETITLSQGSLSTSAAVDISDGATVTINNDDNATVTIADASGNEDDGNITVTLTLDSQVDGGLTVDVSTADGTATTNDSDYTAVGDETVTFTGTAGETQTVTIAATTDAKVEADETLTVSMSNVTATTVATASITTSDTGTVTISNDDTATVTIADASGAEDDGAITLTATLDNPVDGGFTVDVSTADGTASSSDYTSVEAETLTFTGTAGETQTFTVTPTSDETVEVDETVTVSIGNLSETSLSVTISDEATVTITNDDNAPIITAGQTFPIEGILSQGDEIGTVVATDADDATTFSGWTIVSGNTDDAFAIGAGTGLLTVNDPSVIDLIATPSYTLTLTVTDGTNTSAEETVTIEVGDGIAPTVALSSDVGEVTNVSPITVTATFSELVQGFTLSDLTLTNATAANLTGNDAQTVFTFDLTPDAEGTVNVSLEASVVTDAVGNQNEASNRISYFYDITVPTVELFSRPSGVTSETSGIVIIQFSEEVSGLEIAELQISSGTLSNLTGSRGTFSVDVSGLSEGIATLTVPADIVNDAAGNGNTEGSVSWEVDLTGPSGFTVDILNPAINDLNEDNFRFEIIDGEPSSTFTYAVSSSGGGTARTGSGTIDASGSGNSVDQIDVADLGDGELTLTVELIDQFNNTGNTATDVVTKNTEGESNGIAQGYSPNGDNIDDTWTIPGIEDLPNNVVTIFNRYGTKVWETSNYDNEDNSWDSQANVDNIFGSAGLPDGTYFYVIEFPGTRTDTKSGFVILKR